MDCAIIDSLSPFDNTTGGTSIDSLLSLKCMYKNAPVIVKENAPLIFGANVV